MSDDFVLIKTFTNFLIALVEDQHAQWKAIRNIYRDVHFKGPLSEDKRVALDAIEQGFEKSEAESEAEFEALKKMVGMMFKD